MNYLLRYEQLIKHYQEAIPEDGYHEKHHIVPKCMGGTNEKSNIILLPVRAHFVAHLLLHKAYPGNHSLAHSVAMMSVGNKNHKRILSSKQYATARRARSVALRGIPRSEETKAKMRKPKTSTENYKTPKSKEHAKAISEALTGRIFTPDHKSKLRASLQTYYDQRKAATKARNEAVKQEFLSSGLSKKQFIENTGISKQSLNRILR
jgi:hypothetical protein